MHKTILAAACLIAMAGAASAQAAPPGPVGGAANPSTQTRVNGAPPAERMSPGALPGEGAGRMDPRVDPKVPPDDTVPPHTDPAHPNTTNSP